MKPEHVAYSMPAIIGVLVITAFVLDVPFEIAFAMALFAVAALTLLYFTAKYRSSQPAPRPTKGGET